MTFFHPRGTKSNPVPSQFHPLIDRLARLFLKQQGFSADFQYEELFRSQNPRIKVALAFAIASVAELEEWMLDASGNGLEELGEFISGEEGSDHA